MLPGVTSPPPKSKRLQVADIQATSAPYKGRAHFGVRQPGLLD